MRVHQEHLIISQEMAALPFRKQPAAMIPVKREPDRDAIDRELTSNSADGLVTKSSYLFEHRHAPRQITMHCPAAVPYTVRQAHSLSHSIPAMVSVSTQWSV